MAMNKTIVNWPEAAAGKLLLDTPQKWKVAGAPRCKLQLDAENGYIRIVSSTAETTVLDIIDVEDMIGADIQIELLGALSSGALRSATGSSGASTTETAAVSNRAANEPPSDIPVDTQAKATLTIYAYPRKDYSMLSIFNKCRLTTYKPGRDPNYSRPTAKDSDLLGDRLPHFRRFTLAASEDLGDARAVVAALCDLAVTDSSKPRHYLILVNPRSGPSRDAAQLAERDVAPMLRQAGIETTICVTMHPKHAVERCREKPKSDDEKDISEYDGLVLMGGDGIVHEALNGLRQRSDHGTSVLDKLAIGIVGCGTSNGLAASLAHAGRETNGVLHDAFWIAKGNRIEADIAEYQVLTASGDVKTYASFLTFTWAFIAEVDLESEVIHWLGASRFDVWSIHRALFLRKYPAKISYTMEAVNEHDMPAFTDAVPSTWTVIEDDIILLWASQVTHASKSTLQSPASHFQDGIFQIMLVRGSVSRYRLFRILLGLEDGSHYGMPGVEFIECTAYRLEPADAEASFNDIDGEKVESGPVQACVLSKAVKYFGNSHKRMSN